MKKLLFVGIIPVALLLTAGPAFAWSSGSHGHSSFGFGLFIAPPVFAAPPPVYHGGYYPSYGYGYHPRSYRVWVPGYWGWRHTPYGWERQWIPGYWDWR
jgi:hypothetical protein